VYTSLMITDFPHCEPSPDYQTLHRAREFCK